MAPASASILDTTRETWRTALAILAGALLLCWPAFYNGYPLVYDDSASYLDTVDPKKAIWARPIFYTLFLRPFHLHIWLWPAIFAQSLILAHLIYVVARVICGRLAPELYLLLMLAQALTMLPWLTSMIMPHAFTGVVVLGLFLLGFAQHRLGPFEKLYVALLTAGAITMHMSHLGIAIGLLIAILAFSAFLRRMQQLRPAAAAILAFPVAAAILAQFAVNSYARGTLSFAPATSIFLLARFIADGSAVAYLRDKCPERNYVLCAYLDQLPPDSDEFLWPRDGVFRRAGGETALRDEAREIVIGTLRAYPVQQLARTAGHVMRQVVDLRIDSIMPAPDPTRIPDYPIRLYIRGFFPGAYGDYLASRQSTGRLPTGYLNVMHGFVTAVSFVAGAFMMVALIRRGSTMMIALPLMIVAAWIANAIITAGVSGVFGHYQGRLAWLVTLYATLGALCLLRDGAHKQLLGPMGFRHRPQASHE
jgi:hypothetical protein